MNGTLIVFPLFSFRLNTKSPFAWRIWRQFATLLWRRNVSNVPIVEIMPDARTKILLMPLSRADIAVQRETTYHPTGSSHFCAT
jgi:hypothetical protein